MVRGEDGIRLKTMDKIFLLSVEEYERYREHIPLIACYWWLRTPVNDCKDSAYTVDCDGDVIGGADVDDNAVGVRPAIEISEDEAAELIPGEKFVKFKWKWAYLDDNIAIAAIPIEFQHFDTKSNNYEDSAVRRYLRMWYDHKIMK